MITFHKKPISISPEYRPIYRVAQIVMVLGISSTNETASLIKLHYFSWAMRSENNMKDAIKFALESKQEFSFIKIWSIEPSLNRALALSLGEKMIELKNGKYHLTEKGEKFFTAIMLDEHLLINEKKFLNKVKKKISDAKLQRLAKWWENYNA